MTGIIKKVVGFLTVIAVTGVLLMSCKKDEDLGRLYFPVSILPFESTGVTKTVKFTYAELVRISVSSKPKGWEATVDMAAGTLTITSPEKFEGDSVESGTVIITGDPTQGSLVSYSLYVGVMPTIDLTGQRSNSYIASQKNAYYTFDARYKGETTEPLATANVGLIWQTPGAPIKYLSYDEGKVSFYAHASDSDKTKMQEGNALIGAYDAAGTLIWSWHIWVSAYDPNEKPIAYANGYTVMNRNLGALDNANSTQSEILSSYGLYYQWGRKEPFVGPSAYNAPQGTFSAVYNTAGTRIYFTTVASTAETGTAGYALRNPLVFITGETDSAYDWLYTHDAGRWMDSGTKSIYDPCPKGWRVPAPQVFEGLTFADKSKLTVNDADKYGWELTDGTTSSLYMGFGRRAYTDGKIQNIYNPLSARNPAMEAQPWEGLYWTTATEANNRSSAFYFFFHKKNVQTSQVVGATPHYRANGMQIRCVKEK